MWQRYVRSALRQIACRCWPRRPVRRGGGCSLRPPTVGIADTRPERTVRLGAAAAVCGLLLAVPAAGNPEQQADSAPDFALKALDGRNYRLSEYRGEVVALVFWASWCGACRRELERLDSLRRTYDDAGLSVLGVTVDEDSDRARRVAKGIDAQFPQLHDAARAVSREYRPGSLPTTLLIDRAGAVRYRYRELNSREERAMLGELRRLLDE